MEKEVKKENFIEKIKAFFRKIFKKKQLDALPQPEEKAEIKVEVTKEPTNDINLNKEESMKLYNDIKARTISVDDLTRGQLIMFIMLATEELKVLEQKIENEITEANVYKKDIDFYKTEFEKIA
ncbi:MAG: hypothetical protein IKF97_02845 [Clostridia bacterium]|nr:hypothetical protein [Clostridia bacterium]